MSADSFYNWINQSFRDFPSDTLHGLILKSMADRPDEVAVICGQRRQTCRELDAFSDQVAVYLNQKGIGQGDLVGVCSDRDLRMPGLLLGVLKSGAGYVPLDPDYPVDRLEYMVGDSGLKHVLTNQLQEQLVKKFNVESTSVEALEDFQPTGGPCQLRQDPIEEIAYVIYTSGSTGKPKGVLVPHDGVVNMLMSVGEMIRFQQGDRILATTTLSFDISVVEMFLPLALGGTVVVVDRATAKDQKALVESIQRHQINIMQATPAMWRMILEGDFAGNPDMKFITGGEPLPRDLIDPMLERSSEVWNLYGPTETTVYSTGCRVTNSRDRILIGKPVANTTVYVVDENDELCPPEHPGELLIGGRGVTRGYLNRDDLTQEKFTHFQGEQVYRTGDLAQITEDGQIDHLGRIDGQIKLNGHRIELGEIDAAMAAQPGVRRAATVLREDRPGDSRLVGYLLADDEQQPDTVQIRRSISELLPDYMVPSLIVVVDEFFYTPSGKLDRKSFPAPSTQRPDIPTEFVPPTTGLESQIAEIWSDILLIDGLGIHDNFFELGGNSIRAAQVIARVNRETDIQINTAQFFDNPTIASFAKIAPSGAQKSTWFARFQANKKSHHPPFDGPNSKDSCDGGYAIVGMSARMPGADDLDQFWDNLIEQRETISFFTPEELDPSLNVQETRAENYVAARGVIDRAEYFDARFFRTPPRNAELTDPQQRILLELAWAALEDAGINPFDCRDSVGVWAGAYSTSYYIKNVLTNPDLVRQTGEFNVGVLNEKDYIATRIAHALDLKGPAINVNTACSTSLVALIEACKSLAARHCDAALAGGVSIYFPQKSGHLHQTGSIFSPDGHCRPFDADSAGTLFSDGAGLVVVKRLADAIANRDRIYAVVKGFGLNNDGGQKASFSAPSIQGQANAIAMAHAMANIPVETIGYIEAHGTATPIGDPIEVSALQSVFESQTNQKKFCGIGSVKSNIGHTVAAAGVAGLIKAAKSLFHETVPATLHFEKPNPEIDFESSPFFVCDQNMPWERCDTPRRAGISSFGVGGTNAHIILEEAPSLDDETLDDNSRLPFAVIPISAKSEKSLQQNVERLTHHLSHRNADDWDRIVDSLQTRRSVFSYRAAVVASDSKSAADSLGNRCVQSFFERKSTAGRPLIFMFPGQGSQYVNMGQNLYEQSSVFKANLDQCSEILTPLLGQDLRTILYPEPGHEESAQQILKNTRFTQPALFALGYSLGQVWLKWGIEPAGLMGHSIGEFAAACTAGVFELEDGLKMIAERGRLMQELPGGSMLSVRLPGDEVEPMLFGQMAIGSFNGPQLCVVAGPTDQVKQLQNELESQDVVCRYLHTSHAFHSPMMNSIVDPFEEFVGQFPLQAPKIPILSTVTGDWMKEADARNPKYWANHLRAPVRFSDAVLKMWDPKEGDANRVLIEIGPRKTLATLAKQHATDRKNQIAIPTLSDTAQDQKEWKTMFAALAQLWVAGVTIDWSKIAGRSKGQPRPIHISLPTYAFDRKKYFIEPGQVAHSDSVQATPLTNKIEADKTAGCHHERLSKQPVKLNSVETHTMNRVPEIVKAIQTIFEETSGFDLTEFEGNTTFFEMGLDSLVLTQTATALKKEMAIDVTFRQLLEDTSTVDLLAQWLDERLPSEMYAVTSTPTPAPVNQDAAVPNVEQPRQPAESISPGVESQQRLETLGEVQPLEPPTPVAPVSQSSSVVAPPTLVKQPPMPTAAMSGQNDVANIIQSQLQLMQMQMQLLSNAPGSTMASQPIMDAPGSTLASQPIMDAPGSVAADPNGTGQQFADTAVSNSQAVDATGTANNRDDAPEKELAGNRANPDSTDQLSQPAATSNSTDDVQPKKAKRFDTVKRNDDKLDAHQQQALDEIVRLNNIMMPGSKAYAQKHRKYMADPRTVSGFRPNMKEMTHPIVIERSRGVHLWDIDGNEYIDFTCGFGSNLLGHTHDVTVQAITEQVQKDYAIGPQSPLAGEVASLFCELTGHQRMAFSNTGSEAVLGCTRLARNATGKDLIVMFNGDYHGILDEVIARGSKRMKSFPAATGIPKDHVGNTLILEYGSNESLKIINQRMDEIAGILVEPVQSRKPELQPREFLHELRAMTKDQPAALIFDEVISGLRIGLGGAQQHFDVKADLASYGKIFGGGMPIGLIGGKSEYMDGLDGGYWQYGDDSRPEAGMTYFAGTFVRHPLTLAASKAIMDYLKAGGQPMYDRLNALADYLADELNQVFTQLDAPLFLANFGSLFKIQFHQEVVYSEVFFAGLRRRGMHIWDHRPCLLTLAHQKEHIDKMVEATRATIIECQRFGFMPGQGFTKFSTEMSEQPPVPGAEIGKDESGNMGWFLADTLNPGQFIQVGQFSN